MIPLRLANVVAGTQGSVICVTAGNDRTKIAFRVLRRIHAPGRLFSTIRVGPTAEGAERIIIMLTLPGRRPAGLRHRKRR